MKTSFSLGDAVARTVQKYRLLRRGESVVVGVSGGGDSVALLYALLELRQRLSLKLHVAHFDHMLRKTSGRDARFVKKLARKLDLDCSVGAQRVSVPATGSLEEAAREARMRFLFARCRQVGSRTVALGHHQDDQAETVLMRILRGAGLYGLSAIMPKRSFGTVQVIRPLIEVGRRDIESYLRALRIPFVRDETNDEESFLRNRIRRRVLPFLQRECSAAVPESLCRLAETAALDYEFLRQAAQRRFRSLRCALPVSALQRMHPAMRRMVLRLGIERLQHSTRRIGLQHIREIESLLWERPAGSRVDLPGKIEITKTKTRLLLERSA